MADTLKPGTEQDGYRFVGGDAANPRNWEPVGLKIGTVEDGFQFLGGDAADPNNWKKAPGLGENIKDLGTAVVEGAQKTYRSARAAVGAYIGANEDVTEQAKKTAELEQKSGVDSLKSLKEDIQRRKLQGDEGIIAGVRNVAGAVANNPAGGAQLIAEQAPNSAVSLGAGVLGAKGGALAGAAVAPFLGPLAPAAPVVGGIGGFLAGLFGANTLLETGGKAIEAAADGQFTDAERSQAIREGATKGAVVTGVDAVTLGASKFILGAAGRAVEDATLRTLTDAGIDASKAAASIRTAQQAAVDAAAKSGEKATTESIQKATLDAMAKEGLLDPTLRASVESAQKAAFDAATTVGQRAARGGAALGLQTVGEGVGEAAGEYAATGKFSPTDAVLEGVSGMGMSLGELYVAKRLDSPGQLTQAYASQRRAEAEGNLGRAQTLDQAITAADDLAGSVNELEAAIGQLNAGGQIPTPAAASVQPPAATPAGPNIQELQQRADREAELLKQANGEPVGGQPALLRQQAARLEAQAATFNPDEAGPQGQPNRAQSLMAQAANLRQQADSIETRTRQPGAGFEADRQSALAQIEALRAEPKPRVTENFVDLTPMDPRQAQARLAVLRDETAQAGGNALGLAAVAHPSQPGKFAIVQQPLPSLDLGPAPAPTVTPAEAQFRIETAALTGKVEQAKAEDQNSRQVVIDRALRNVEERGGVASPAEARIFQEANLGTPYDRIDESLAGELSMDQKLTQATGIALDKAPRSEMTQPTGPTEQQLQVEENNARSDSRMQQLAQDRAAQQTAAATDTRTAPEAPAVDDVIAALRTPGATRTAEQNLTISQAQQRMAPADFQIAQTAATGPFNLSQEQRVRLREMRAPQSVVSAQQSGEAAVAQETPAAAPGLMGERVARALGLPSNGTVVTTTAKFSTQRTPAPGMTDTVTDTETDESGQTREVQHQFTVVDAGKMGAQGKLLQQIARIFGKRLVVFQSPTLKADGFVRDGDNRNIFINADSQISPLAVFGHELLHILKREAPQAYAALEAVVKRNLSEQGRADFDAYYGSGANLEELTADLMGNQFQDSAFWSDVFEEIARQNPEGARAVVLRVAAAMNRAINAFMKVVQQGQFKSDEFVSDLQAIKAAVKDATVAYAQQQREASIALDRETQAPAGETQPVGRVNEQGQGFETLFSKARPGQKAIEDGRVVEQSEPLTPEQWNAVREIALKRLSDTVKPEVLAAEEQYQREGVRADEDSVRLKETASKALEKMPMPQLSTVEILKGNAALKVGGTGRGGKPRVFDVARALRTRFLKRAGDITTEQGREAIARAMVHEALYSLSMDGHAVGWYDRKVREAIAVSAMAHPELLTDPESNFAFRVIVAVTSNGQAVRDNFILGNDLYKAWRDGRAFPEAFDGGGPRAEAMKKAMAKVNLLVKEYGWERTEQELMKLRPVRDIENTFELKISGENKDTMVPTAVGMGGPKIGNFFANLSGYFDSPTMDLWFMRTVGRMGGTILETKPGLVGYLDQLLEILPAKGSVNNVSVDAMRKEIAAYKALAPEQRLDPEITVKTLAKVDQYARAQWAQFAKMNDDGKTFTDRSPANLNSRSLINNLAAMVEAPTSGAQRNNLRQVVERALFLLHKQGVKLNAADLQAVLWYYEKNLYGKLGDISESAKPWDYASAARFGVGRELGLVDVGASTRTGQVRGGELGELDAEQPAGVSAEVQEAAQGRRAKAAKLSRTRAEQAENEATRIREKYLGTPEWLKAPNGKPTKLTERQWIQVRTPQFKAWFGDWEKHARAENPVGSLWSDDTVSKVVDDNGEPLVVYHGTDKGGFSEFNTPGGTKRGDLGIFATPNRAMALTYVKRGRGREIEFADMDREPLEGGDTSGYYASFMNLRNPQESDFEGANWSGERIGQFKVIDEQTGDTVASADGRQYFNEREEAEALAAEGELRSVESADDDIVGETTDSVVRDARRYNDGAIIRNVMDDGGGYSSYAGEPSDVFVAFQPNQLKSATQNTGEFGTDTNDMRFSRSRQTETPEFKRWSGGAPVIELGDYHEFRSGEPVVVEALHGTTNADLVEFKRSRANIESDMGAGFYASNTPEDVAANYANNDGPDLTQRVELLAERLAQDDEFEDDMDAAREEARRRLSEGAPNTMKLFMRFNNPVVLGDNETYLDYSEPYNEETDEYEEPTGQLVDFVEALREIAPDFNVSDREIESAIAKIFEEAQGDSLKASDVRDIVKRELLDAYDDEGNSASNEIFRQALSRIGFDGVIDTTVYDKFGPRVVRNGQTYDRAGGMKGMNEGTVHFIAFEPEQIKSATGNSGEFGENRNILKSSTRTPEFKRWFGDSKVVDSKGEPLVMYHGTRPGNDITAFDTPNERDGIYFTPDPSYAESFTEELFDDSGAQGAIYPVYLSLQNPYEVRTTWGSDEAEQFLYRGLDRRELERQGFDGATLYIDGELDQAMVFKPEQIKSVYNERPTNNPDITKSKQRIVGESKRAYTPEQLAMFKNTGRTVEVPTIKERIAEMRKDVGKKLARGIADSFRPLRDLSQEAYALARLSKGAAGAFEAFLHHGRLSIRENVYDADTSGGFIERLGVPLQGELEDFMWWVAANRAKRLKAEGRENLFSDADIAAGLSLDNGTTDYDYTIQYGPEKGKVTRDRTKIYRDAQVIFNEFHKNALDIAEQSGLIDGQSRKMWENEFYVPFYRVSEEDGGFVGSRISNQLVRQRAFKMLKGGTDKLNSDLLANTLQNWGHLIDAAAKNRAAKASLEAASSVGVAVESDQETVRSMSKAAGMRKNVVWFMDQGKERYFLVEDPYVLEAITSLEFAGLRGPLMDTLSRFKHWLTIGVTASPSFKIRNLIRDSLQAIATSDLSYNPATNLREGFRATDRKGQDYVTMLASGALIRFGTMEGSQADQTRRLIRRGVKDSTILDSESKVRAFYDRYIEPGITAYNEIGNRGEEINRAALYTQLRKQGKSHQEASLMARDLMDFSMQGAWTTIRFLTQVVPFMNARIQGLYKLGRASQEDVRRFSIVLGAVALMSVSLLAAYQDDDDWKKREDWDRNNNWWFKFGGVSFRIPKPFEIGAIATVAERGLEYFTSPEMTGKRLGKNYWDLLMDSLAMNPVPQLAKPIIDLYANKDSFSGRPIETMGMERLKPQYRYTQNTSMVARAASTATFGALSPVQYDHLLRGYFGWLGTFVVSGADYAIRPLTSEPSRPAPDYWRMATAGFVQELPASQSRYVSQMYDQAKVLEQAYGTYRQLLKEGKREEAAAFREANREELAKYRSVERVKQAEARFNERIRMIERSAMEPAEKKEKIRAIQQQKDKVARLVAPGLR